MPRPKCPRDWLPRLRSRPARARLRVDTLEERIAPATLPANLDGNLAALYRFSFPDPADKGGNVVQSVDVLNDLLIRDREGHTLVQLWADADVASVLSGLSTLGITPTLTDPAHRLVEAAVQTVRLPELAALPGVAAVTPAYRPVTRAGSVQTQGDAVLRADLVRAAGFDGSPIKVGIISDSSLYLANSQGTADLPGTVERYLEFAGSDEGRAMLEIVHDIAPGAGLASYAGIYGSSSMAQGIRELAAVGSRVVVDDLGYFSEPFFQDGVIAQAVDEVAATGVVYVSAAGNDKDLSYEADFVSSGGFHDFDPATGTDTKQTILVPAGYRNTLVLQWDDPFFTTSGVTHNFDVKVYNAGGSLVASVTTDNVATRQPLEVIAWNTVGSGTVSYQVEIERKAGAGASRLKYLLLSGPGTAVGEYATNSSTIYGQPAAAGAIAVGAVPYYAPTTIEPFSSIGNTTILFDPLGNRLGSAQTRAKPDVVAPDAVNNTFFGADIPQDADTLPNFTGTSAAAPHVAGVAALLLDANPHLTRQQVVDSMTATAIDLGATGRDPVYGAGRVDAQAARLHAQGLADTTGPTALLASPITTHAWSVGTLKVRYSEPVAVGTVVAANHRLLGAGPDNVFGTGDDVTYTATVAYNADALTATVTPTAPTTTLGLGLYRLTLDATAGLADPTGNALNGGADQVIPFAVDKKSGVVIQPFAQSPGAALAVRPDGSALVVQPANPVAGNYAWPQLLVGQFDPGGGSPGGFHTVPTDIYNSFRVTSVDVAATATAGVAFYGDKVFSGGGGEPPFYDIGFQRLDGAGRPVGAVTLIPGFGVYSRFVDPVIRTNMNAAGAFILAYSGQKSFPNDQYPKWVFAQRFDASGAALGSRIDVGQTAGGEAADVALAADGSSLFVWALAGRIMARRFDPSGNPVGGEFVLAALPTLVNDAYTNPSVVQKSDGTFIVAWQGSGTGLYVQRFTAAGVPQGPVVQVFVKGVDPRVAVADDGRFAVAFSCPDASTDADSDDDGLFVQRFNADGTFNGTRLWVTGQTTGTQTSARLAMLADGRMAVAWSETNGVAKLRYYAADAPSEPIPYGPYIRAIAREGSPSATLSSLTVAFDRPINPGTFTVADVTLTDPVGRAIVPSNVTTADNQTFTISFPTQSLPGRYTVAVGPNVLDTAATAMNQDGNGVNGQTTDAFVGYVRRESPVAATVPTAEGFEVADIDALADYWSFAWAAGIIDVTTQAGPSHGGTRHLRMANTSVNQPSRDAVLKLDLTANVGSTNLFLDFWLQRLAGFYETSTTGQLQVSGDGVNWVVVTDVLRPSIAGSYLQYVYDLDQALATAGVAHDGDVYVKFNLGAYYNAHGMTLDDFRVSTTNPFGPRITTQSPSGTVAGPVSSISVTFNEAIDPATLTTADVRVIAATGATIPLTGNPVNSGDNKTFTLNLASTQVLRGAYQLSIGPDVKDADGYLMNQNADNANGELDGSDVYRSTFQIGPSVAQGFPYTQGFESGDITNLPGWSFEATGGLTEVSATNGPQAGSYHLQLNGVTQPPPYTGREAILKLNLAGQAGATNLTLDYWMKKFGNPSATHFHQLYVSGDGVTWRQAGSDVVLLVGNYVHKYWDLDQILASATVTLDADVYLKFGQYAYDAASVMTFDDVRVSTTETVGARITSHTPTGQQAGPVTALTVTFNEDMDAASFTAADVELIDPTGQIVSLAGNPVDTGDRRKFTITPASGLTLRGLYSFKVGPDVRDLAGNWMNQDQDTFNAEPTVDQYVGTFTVGPATARTLPVLETFEGAGAGSLNGWSFETSNWAAANGTIELTGADGPYLGAQHVRFTSGTPNNYTWQDAILKLDLAAQSSATDLVLDFWTKRGAGNTAGSTLRLYASGDGVSFTPIDSGSMFSSSSYGHLAFDLDQKLANAGIARDADVYLKFQNYSFLANGVMTLDDLRIRQGALNNAPTLTTANILAGGVEDTGLSITHAMLAAATDEADVNGDPVSFRVEAVSSGTLTKGGVPVTPGTTLLASGESWVWTPPANANGTLNAFTIRAHDGDLVSGTPIQVRAAVTAVNDVPSFNKGGDQSVAEDAGAQTVTGWATGMSPGPADEAAQTLTFIVTNDNAGLFSTAPAVNATTGTLTYTPAANANGSATVTVKLKDTGGIANGGVDTSAGQTFAIAVSAVNDAPVLDNAGVMSLAAILEDATGNGGTLVADVIASASGDRITDVDAGALEGLAITAADTAGGVWEYSTNNGGAWSALGSVSESTARLLYADAGTKVRLVPNADWNGTLATALTFRAWDRTNGTNGGTIDITAHGGTTAFSSATETASLVVTAVNDVPSFTKGADQVVDEDAGARTVTGWATSLSAGPANESAQTLSFLVTNDNSTLFSSAPAVNSSGTLTFTPAPNANGSAVVTVRVQDTGGVSNGGVDTSAPQTFTITVNAVNDAPVLDAAGSMSLTGILEDDSASAGTSVTALIASAGGDRITDVDTAAVEGIAVTTANTAGGSWQFTTDNGGAWSPLGTVTVATARLLSADAGTRVRFVPNPDFNGAVSAALTFRAWDRTTGINGGTLDVTSNGGITAFSTAEETASLTVTGVNDVPGFTAGLDQTVLEDAGTQTVSGWASSITAGPANESSQIVSFIVTNDNPGLFVTPPAVDASGVLTFTPAANAHGSATVTVRLSDNGGTLNGGVDTSAPQTFAIEVTSVNDVPSFTAGADQAVLEDAGSQTVTGWASGLSAGPADETGQALSFLVTTDNASLFSAPPAVDATTGTLTYTPAVNANGSATVTVRLLDGGGTANGGVDTSSAQTFNITVTAVNDVPGFSRGPDPTALEDASLQTVAGWATGIIAGPANEAAQGLSFAVSNDNAGLFSVAPAVAADGTLTFRPAADANGSATVSVHVQDSGGTANGGVDASAVQTFTITVTAVNDAPAFAKGADQSLAEDDGPRTIPGWATGIVAGPADEAGQALGFTAISDNTALFAAPPTIDAAGTLTFTPAAGANGTATVTVTLADDGGTAGGGADTSAAQVFTITVGAVNDAPSFTVGADQSVPEDAGPQSVGGWATAILAGPPDEAGQALAFLVSTDNVGLFSVPPALDAAGGLTFTPAADAHGSATIRVELRDDAGGTDTSPAQTFTITVNAINDAPVLDPTPSPTLAPIPRTSTDPAGDPVAGLLGTAVGDVDLAAVDGIAVVSLSDGDRGTWQFSSDGQAWSDFGPTSAVAARLLRDTDFVRFVPAAGFAGTVSLVYHAWDRTAGTAGDTFDLAATGGTTAFSTATETARLRVAMTLTPVPEDARSAKGDASASLLGTFVTDPDAKAVRGIAVVGVTGTSSGTWQYSTDGRSWKPLGAVGPDRARLLRDKDKLRFLPTGHFHGLATVHYHAWDQTFGKSGTTADLTAAGATGAGTAFSTAQDLAFAEVLAVNDPPVLDPGGVPALTPFDPGAANPPGDLVSALLGAAATDPDGDRPGIAVTSSAGSGRWQYREAGDADWMNFGKVSARSAKPLAPDARVRFMADAGAGPARLTFRAWDGSSVSKATGIAATAPATGAPPANTAPVLDAGPVPAFTPIPEDLPTAGDQVSALLGAAVTDPDPKALRGIAVTAAGPTNGVWQFSTNGRSWKPVGPVSPSNALLLRDTDRVRFVPARDFHGSATLGYHAWDRTRGTAGARADLTAGTGATTPFSVDTESASQVVTPANDRPVLKAGTVLPPVAPNAPRPDGDPVSRLVGSSVPDVDGDPLGVAVTGAAGGGRWEFRPEGSGTWEFIGLVSTATARLLGPGDAVRFVPGAGFRGTARLTYRAWDGTAGTAGQTADVAIGTAFSRTTATAAQLVNEGTLPDRPVLNPRVRLVLTPVRTGEPEPAGDLVSRFLAGASDPDPGAVLGIAIVGTGPAAGVWQVHEGGGWADLASNLASAPKTLAADSRIRFVPDPAFVGVATLKFKAWDGTALSAATGTATLVVNTAPDLSV